MSCTRHSIKYRSPSKSSNLPQPSNTITDSVIVPIFCVCMISAMGYATGLRHAVFMQFDVDADTEYIKTAVAGIQQLQYSRFEESFLKIK